MKVEINHYLKSLSMPETREEKNNLSYCTICRTVYETWWGFSYGLQETKHHDMPTYGIKRKNCKDCE